MSLETDDRKLHGVSAKERRRIQKALTNSKKESVKKGSNPDNNGHRHIRRQTR